MVSTSRHALYTPAHDAASIAPGGLVASCSPAGRNAGMHTASGEAIAWLDSDDYWEPNHLETVVPLLERHRVVEVVRA